MNNNQDIEAVITFFVEAEKDVSPNPFLATRVMAAIDQDRKEVLPLWHKFAMGLGLAIAITLGIKMGSINKSYVPQNDQSTVLFANDNVMESFMFYQQKPNE